MRVRGSVINLYNYLPDGDGTEQGAIVDTFPVQSVQVGDWVLMKVKIDKVEDNMLMVRVRDKQGCYYCNVPIEQLVALLPDEPVVKEIEELQITGHISDLTDMANKINEVIAVVNRLARGEK